MNRFNDSKIVDDHGKLLRVFHGTPASVSPDFVFKKEFIGTQNDMGHYGYGFYFALTRGEARYYGPNVIGAYLNLHNPLILTNETNDCTGLGHFLDWASKLKSIDALCETYTKALDSAQKAIDYVRCNIEYLLFRGRDGSDGYMARIRNPSKQRPYPKSLEVSSVFGSYKTEAEALDWMIHRFINELRYDSVMFPELDLACGSLSDYVRTSLGSRFLTEQAKKHGHDGIWYGDELIAFSPDQIAICEIGNKDVTILYPKGNTYSLTG